MEIEIGEGPDAGTSFRTDQRQVSVGSHSSNDLILTDPMVSRFHLSLERSADGILVRDLDSRNGTFAGRLRIREAMLVGARDLVRVGNSTLAIRALSRPESLPSEPTEFGRLFGRSDAMQRLFRVLERVSDTEATVLLSGETGVGKSLVARSLHAHSRRREQPLIVVDCAALPPTLIESELFGHEKGSFTGADQGRDGAFQAAHRGTLFLDEIGELPLDLQPKFLRSIEERVVKRVGATEAQPFDVRLIAASNRDLQAMVKEGSFRSDLYYRLDVVRLRVPPLRERRPDIRPLAEGFIQAAGAEHAPELSESEWTAIINAPWPGNVRELRTAVERALVLGDKSLLVSAGSGAAELERPEIDWTVPFREAKRKVVDAFERAYVSRLVTETEGNLSAAARRAKMDRNYLRTLVSRHLADE